MLSSARRCHALLRGAMPPRVRLLPHPRVCALSRPPIRSQSSLRSFIENLHQSPEDKSAATEDAHDKSAGTEDARDSLQVKKDLYHIGTVTTKNPSNTDISSLIDQIEPVPFLIPDNKRPTAMLLVTPSFASALKPLVVGAPEAITQAASRMLQQSLEHGTLLKGIRVVAAVVDRLPSPEDSSQASKGREGLAYALWFNDNVTRHSWTAERDVKRKSERSDAAASLSFDIFDRFKLADLEGQSRRDYSTTIIRLRLPLANTLFQTGHTSIMYNILYRASEIDEPVHSEHAALQHRRTLHAEKVTKTDSQRVTWPVSGRYLAHRVRDFPMEHETLHQLRAPLVPLTPPRPVKAGMGNIIRQIIGPDGKEAPASQELEKAVSSYFEATGQAPHAMPVWALVTSEKTTKYFSSSVLSALKKWQPRRFSQMYDYAGLSSLFMADAWNADHKLFHSAVWNVLLRGNGKLHRVLSGGGGWGKKAGLISLDPAKSISEAAENAADVDEMDPATEQSLQPVAVPGSYITFLTSPVSSLELPKYEQDTCVFGTVPSTIDDIPDTTTEEPSSIDAWPGYFGALSEQGMSIKSVRQHSERREHYSQTMVDVPFSLLVTSNRLPTRRNLRYATPKSASSPNNIMSLPRHASLPANASGLMNTRAKHTLSTYSVRNFSSTPSPQIKTKQLRDWDRPFLRPMIAISRRLRQVDLTTLEVPETTAQDFRMTLEKYPRFWRVSRWILKHSEEQLAVRPVPRVKRPRTAPLQRLIDIWQGRRDAAKAHMVKLRDGHMRMLTLQTEASAQYIHVLTRQIQHDSPFGAPRLSKTKWRTSTSEELNKLQRMLKSIKNEELAVTALPFPASEVTEIAETAGHKSQLKCKKREDDVFPHVVRFRRKLRKRNLLDKYQNQQKARLIKRGRPDLSGQKPKPNYGTIHFKPGQDTKATNAPIQSGWSSMRPISQPFGRNQQRRHLSYSHRNAAPDSSSSPTAAGVEPKPDADPMARTELPLAVLHPNHFGHTRELFVKKRRLDEQRLRDAMQAVKTGREHELAYLDDAVTLSQYVSINLMLQCATVNPIRWHMQLRETARLAKQEGARRATRWPAMWYASSIDPGTVKTGILNMRQRVLRASAETRFREVELSRRVTRIVQLLLLKEENSESFRLLRGLLVARVRERLRVEPSRRWARKFVWAIHAMRYDEIAYLTEALETSEKDLEAMETMLLLIKYGADEQLKALEAGDLFRSVFRKYQSGMDVNSEMRANDAWTLASELENLLGVERRMGEIV